LLFFDEFFAFSPSGTTPLAPFDFSMDVSPFNEFGTASPCNTLHCNDDESFLSFYTLHPLTPLDGAFSVGSC